MVTAFAMDPLIGSSTLLVFDATGLRSVTLSDVPAGIVTSRNVGSGGPSFDGGCAGAADVDSLVAAAVTGVDASGCPGAGDTA
jgi:hypothetical protein